MKCNLPKPMSRKERRELETALNKIFHKNPVLAVTETVPSYMDGEPKQKKAGEQNG